MERIVAASNTSSAAPASATSWIRTERRSSTVERELRRLIRELLTEGAKTGEFRDDVSPDELARYCLHSLTAAGALPSKTAVHRLVKVTLAGLRPSR